MGSILERKNLLQGEQFAFFQELTPYENGGKINMIEPLP